MAGVPKIHRTVLDGNLQESPQSVRVALQELGATGAGSVTLTVLEENGIVAVDDGGTWEGVSDLSLPFEE